jgi:hypothetical protein
MKTKSYKTKTIIKLGSEILLSVNRFYLLRRQEVGLMLLRSRLLEINREQILNLNLGKSQHK